MKHSPEPWFLGPTGRVILDRDERRVATVHDGHGMPVKGNVSLLVLAPGLLAFVEKIAGGIELAEGLVIRRNSALHDEAVALILAARNVREAVET